LTFYEKNSPHAFSLRAEAAPRRGNVARAIRHQKGAAILMAMLTVTLVATLAAAALWQQWRSVEVETAQRARVQSGWILVGALDFARLILREDARSGGADHLAEPWAVPLEEARLTSFFASGTASDTTQQDDIQQAFMSGQIIDLQGRLNVRNLVEGGKVAEPVLRQFARLFTLLGVPEGQLPVLAENLRLALEPAAEARPGVATPLMPQRVEQLVWLGLSHPSIALLAPFITILPQSTPVNLNTAPAEVIFASIEEPDMALARRLVTARALSHYKTLAEAARLLGDVPGQIVQERHSVSSRYFEVRGKLRLDDVAVNERSLVVRDGLDVKVLWRERTAGVPRPGP
jgi:general secretion pathway protein K